MKGIAENDIHSISELEEKMNISIKIRKVIDVDNIELIGASESYMPLCRLCYKESNEDVVHSVNRNTDINVIK